MLLHVRASLGAGVKLPEIADVSSGRLKISRPPVNTKKSSQVNHQAVLNVILVSVLRRAITCAAIRPEKYRLHIYHDYPRGGGINVSASRGKRRLPRRSETRSRATPTRIRARRGLLPGRSFPAAGLPALVIMAGRVAVASRLPAGSVTGSLSFRGPDVEITVAR